MKFTIGVGLLFLFNTAALLAEPLSFLTKGLSSWILIAIEFILVLCYWVHIIVRDVRKATQIDFNDIDLFR